MEVSASSLTKTKDMLDDDLMEELSLNKGDFWVVVSHPPFPEITL
jgi:hypothetical protein